jgi:ankyrin repeat protein
MLHAEWLEYLKRENKSKNFEQIKNYYMPRKLRRFIQIDRKILEQKNNNLIIVHTDEDFNEECRQNPKEKNIHYLIESKINRNLLWRNSSGSISSLNEFIVRKEEEVQLIDENLIFQKNKEKILIISAEPGMGKSFILDNFTQNSSVENFFIKIVLNTCRKTLSDIKFEDELKKSNDLLEFVLKSLLGKKDEQEISLLKRFAQEEKLILMFDGLDEVNDYKERVIHLIDEINSNFKIKKILITTRNHLKKELENNFRTFAFDLNNFSDHDQKEFLYKYWRSSNLKQYERASSAKLKQSAEDLITKIKSFLSKNIYQLIGIPLQTKMLADIFVDKEKDFSKIEITNIAELYHHFLESKIKIQIEEKSQRGVTREKKEKLDREKKMFYSDHIKLSSLILFENIKEIKQDLELSDEEILEYGVVVAFAASNKTPTFLHQSFAEFFLAKSSLQKLLEQNNKNDKELKQILRDKRHFLIRKFLNDLIEKEGFQRKEITNEKEDFKLEIENCCGENLLFLLKHFIQQNRANLKIENEFLIIASKEKHMDIVAYLIENGIDVNQQNEYGLGLCPRLWARMRGRKSNIHNTRGSDWRDHEATNFKINEQGSTPLMMASIQGDKEIVQVLLKNENINVNKQDYNGRTALMNASEYGQKEVVELLLDKKDTDVNKQDEGERTALMIASENEHIEIVELLLQYKNINVNKQDKHGNSALMIASEKEHEEIVLLLLQHKDIQINGKYLMGETILMKELQHGHIEAVQLLLKHKDIDVNQHDDRGWTALFYADHKDIAQLLLGHKDINVNVQSNSGTTLFKKLKNKMLKIVLKLMKDDVIDDEYMDFVFRKGLTALMLASKRGNEEVVHLLLGHKDINVNLKDEDEQTALYWASKEGHEEVVRLLIEHKDVNVNQKNKKGKNALIVASENDHSVIVQMLEENMKMQTKK